MNVRAAVLALSVLLVGCRQTRQSPVEGPFSEQELKQFTSMNPIDAHTHIFVNDPKFNGVVDRLNLHLLDIFVVDDTSHARPSLAVETVAGWSLASANPGRVSICTTFDAYQVGQPHFAQTAVGQINQDFDRGAVAAKVWLNIGMEIKDASGNYLMPDDPIFDPIYQDIVAHNKTLIAHTAAPDGAWERPDPKSPSSGYYITHPEWSMYRRPGAPSKAKIMAARDHVLQEYPTMRVVGAHLGSMEDNLDDLGQHLDRYPNFAVDVAARMPNLIKMPRQQMIDFITRYQDRLIYGTDLERGFGEPPEAKNARPLADSYARIWRYFATNDTLTFGGGTIQGLDLPPSVVHKIYHDNAVKWFPGILATGGQDSQAARPNPASKAN